MQSEASDPATVGTASRDDPLVRALRSATQTATSPRVRRWLSALLRSGERAEGSTTQQAEQQKAVRR